MNTSLATIAETPNPLDNVEDILEHKNWTFDRMNEDELAVEVSGKAGTYRLFFIWDDGMNALHFCAQYNLSIHRDNLEEAARALLTINENLWMGYFVIPQESLKPSFRHTHLLGLDQNSQHEQLNTLVDIAMSQCERHYHAFSLLSQSDAFDNETLPLAFMETQGVS